MCRAFGQKTTNRSRFVVARSDPTQKVYGNRTVTDTKWPKLLSDYVTAVTTAATAALTSILAIDKPPVLGAEKESDWPMPAEQAEDKLASSYLTTAYTTMSEAYCTTMTEMKTSMAKAVKDDVAIHGPIAELQVRGPKNQRPNDGDERPKTTSTFEETRRKLVASLNVKLSQEARRRANAAASAAADGENKAICEFESALYLH